MSEKKLININQEKLEEQILALKKELAAIEKTTRSFEHLLRSHLSDLIIEAQELYVLYKEIKKKKKEKRLEQKKRGKNYTEPTGLIITPKKEKTLISAEQQKEKKRLYREAMLHVHPDKFFMKENETDIATELTSKLIEIYKTESLESLQAFHAHIFEGNTALILSESAAKVKVMATGNYLQQEIERLEKAIDEAKNEQLYKIVTEYENPLTFVDELKDYYENRILQLKKRTRKGL
ncbi:hypothetical protein [Arcticibacterium luteifluviistationis]|uniref:J domain-containing protein n=1 Tax=Arcticibacterium luteifluviistationis TaxID=1784714 RepID=A0A2Z4G7Q8_9BACT|nr:hypothetical protein [Arcticibacterium luteifluviistationis]AWV97113.1 hypothetical protein DJ013_02555 [Arcticibacterium luteifluviistationis]